MISVRPFKLGCAPGFEMGMQYEICTAERTWSCIIDDSELVRHPAAFHRLSDFLIEQFRSSGAPMTYDHQAAIRFAMHARSEWLIAKQRTDHERSRHR